MKAAVYYQGGGPEVLKYEEIPDPTCGPYEILIEVHAVSIEGGDVLARGFRPAASEPHVGGYLAAGVIVRTACVGPLHITAQAALQHLRAHTHRRTPAAAPHVSKPNKR